MTFDHLVGDLRVVLRSLRRSPGFTSVVTATLAIGIGSVTALFSAVYSYAYRPLPYRDADRIIAIQELVPGRPYTPMGVSVRAARAVIDGSASFELTSVYQSQYSSYVLRDRPTQWSTMLIDSSFAPLFGLQPQLGRNLTPEEIRSGSPSALISDALWRSAFGADPEILGKTFRVGDTVLTIVGVLPEGFRYPMRTNVWRPLRMTDSTGVVTFLGKRKPRVSPSRVAFDLSLIARRLGQADSARFARVTLTPTEMVDRNVGAALRIALLFVGAAALVLLIACANVVNLFLVRAAERRGEMSIRASLGATKIRLIMRGLLEALVIAVVASAIGCALSIAIVKVGLAVVPGEGMPSWVRFDVNGSILVFTVSVCAVVTLAVGMIPALEGSRPDLMRMLKAGGDRSLSRGGVGKRARAGIIVQLTFSVVLLIASLLFARTYQRIAEVDLGYPASQIGEVSFSFTDAAYAGDTATVGFARRALQNIRTIPGATRTAIRGYVNTELLANARDSRTFQRRPVTGERPDTRLFADGELARSREAANSSRFLSVSRDYFQVMGQRVIAGRGILESDVAGDSKVGVVSRRFADLLWPGTSPIGHTIRFGSNGVTIVVVGVVENIRSVAFGRDGISANPQAEVYFSIDQVHTFRPAVLMRGEGDVTSFRVGAEGAVRSIDPMMQTVFRTLDESIKGVQFQSKFFGGLLFAFAIAGLMLSVIGIYGIVAYGITERTREIGIRIALGGTSEEVLGLVFQSSLRFIGLGLAVGLVVSQGTNRLLAVLLYDVSPVDPLSYVVVCLVFGVAGMLSAYLPARRVLRVDPVIALRAD